MNDFFLGVLVSLLIFSVPISFLTFHYLQSRKFDRFLSSLPATNLVPQLDVETQKLIEKAQEILAKNNPKPTPKE